MDSFKGKDQIILAFVRETGVFISFLTRIFVCGILNVVFCNKK